MADGKKIVKEGWLQKKGVYIPNWRPRYFQLFNDGTLLGYKGGPPSQGGIPENSFRVSNCKVVRDQSKSGLFNVGFLDQNCVINRLFKVDSSEEREAWVAAINETSVDSVAPTLKQQVAGGSTSWMDSKDANITLEDFDMLSVLGRGTFGKVMLATYKTDGSLVAIKLLKKSVIMEKEEIDHTLNENRVLRQIKHPFLTSLKAAFQTPDRLCFVLEYVNGGELFFHLSRDRIFDPPRARFYGAEILLGLGYLHQKGIVYRDLKLENLLLDSEGHIKITDFGLCKENVGHGETTGTFCGTPEYLAPEVLEDNDYTRAVDWWGLGVVMYEMMCGCLPFVHRNHDVLFNLILNEDVKFPRHLTSIKHATDLLNGLLEKSPSKRLGGGPADYEDIRDHPFFDALNFEDLYDRKIKPPFKPNVSSPTDVSNFEGEFTQESTELSPTDSCLDDMDQFEDFNYIPA